MLNRLGLFKKSFEITNSCLIFVFLLFMIDIQFAHWNFNKSGYLSALLLIPIKIFMLGGIFGTVIELSSHEEYLISVRRFLKNAKQYWLIYFFISTMVLMFHMFLSVNRFISPRFEIYHVYAHFDLIFSYIIILFIIYGKYLQPNKLNIIKFRISFQNFLCILVLHTAQLFFFYLPYYFLSSWIDIPRISSLMVIYLNLWSNIYIAGSILEQYPDIKNKFSPKNEILFINPLGGGIFYYFSSMFMPHSTPAFIVLRALTPKKYKTREFSFKTWHNSYYSSGKLVAITCFTSNCCDAYKIASEFKKRGSKVVIGGPHVTYLPEEALNYCDSVVIGEAESAWKDIIADYENGSLKKFYRGVALDNCHELVHKELLNSPPCVIKDFLETTRGCKFKCTFCMVPGLSDGKVRTKPIFELVELLKKVRTEFKYVTFIDNNIYSDPTYARELFKAIKPLRLKWSTQCTIDIAKNAETLQLAKEAGCNGFLIGFEISEGSFEKTQGGKLSLADHYLDYAKKIRAKGIRIKAHFIFGFETDRLENLFRFWKFCFSIRPYITIMSVLTPFPGTKVYEDMIQQDRITNLNWRNYGCQSLVFRHDKINSFVLDKLWPAIYFFFFLTTSSMGHFYIAIVAVYNLAHFIRLL